VTSALATTCGNVKAARRRGRKGLEQNLNTFQRNSIIFSSIYSNTFASSQGSKQGNWMNTILIPSATNCMLVFGQSQVGGLMTHKHLIWIYCSTIWQTKL